MPAPVWRADIPIDAGIAAATIAEQFPHLRAAAVEPFGSGWDNAAFLVGGALVFRFPRRRVAVRLIERECALLPLIAPHLPLPISAPAFAGSPSPRYPWPFAGYTAIAGSTLCSLALDDAARAGLAPALGRFLRALHGIDPGPLAPRGLPADEIGRLDHRKRLALARDRSGALAAAGIADGGLFLDWLESHPPGPIAEARRTVVHGDLYARHVLVDASGAASGVIDWGDIHLGDPALDIAIAHLTLPPGAHDAFRAAYGPIDERTWTAARFRAIYHAIVEIDYGLQEGDAGMLSIGVAALDFLRDALPG